MGAWVVLVYISAILAFWATLASAQMNICKLRLRFVFPLKHLIFSVVVMDEGNSQAKQGLDSALKYLESENPAAVNSKSEIYLKTNLHHQIAADGRLVLI